MTTRTREITTDMNITETVTAARVRIRGFRALLGGMLATTLLLGFGVTSALAAVPVVTNQAVTRVTDDEITLNGTVATDSALTDCYFEYVDATVGTGLAGVADFSDLSSGGSVPCASSDGAPLASPGDVPADSAAHVIEATLAIPHPHAPVYYRLVAANVDGSATTTTATTTTGPWQGSGFGVTNFDGSVLDFAGDPEIRAGSHPGSASTSFWITNRPQAGTTGVYNIAQPTEELREAIVDLPSGLVGNPEAVPTTCTTEQLVAGTSSGRFCPTNSQVGFVEIRTSAPASSTTPTPLFSMPAPQGSPAVFGFNLAGVTIFLSAEVRSGGDYGISIRSSNVSNAVVLTAFLATIWGDPGDPSHDLDRGFSGATACVASASPTCTNPYTDPEVPFMTLPTSCVGSDGNPGTPLETKLHAVSWQGGEDDSSFLSHDNSGNPIGNTDCDNVPFDPDADVAPTTRRADSPSGFDFDLEVPQDGLLDPDGIATAHLKKAVVQMPEGMAVNPSSADGLESCTPAEIGLDTADPASCPDASKLGAVTIDTPLLDHPIAGSVYLAEQSSFQDQLIALYIAADDKESGIVLKLPGIVEPDEDTGRLTATFDDQPQLPFSKLSLHMKSGARAPLVTPTTCGTYDIVTELTPWSGNDPVTQTSKFTINKGADGGPCETGDPSEPGDPSDLADRPFDPKMTSGVINPVAGSFSPFIFRLTRQDGEQEILSTEVTPPEGVTGKLAGIPLCSNQDAEAGTCDESSKVGEVIAGAGAGPTPFYIQGDNAGSVYLSGPYKGAPLSLQIQVPAIAGPFDLGEVNVRAAMFVDRRTAQLHVVSDPIPQILEGIPLRVKDLRIRMNRDQFTIAPTSCNEMQVTGLAHGTSGAEADLTNRFQVGDCASLGFSPKLNLQYKGKGSKKRNSHPRLAANLKIPGADAVASGAGATQTNIKKVRVVLPRGTFLDQDALSRVCTPTQWEAESCPEDSKIGNAKAWSPILDEPLKGPVYLKVGPNELPDLAADLNGIVPIDLYGKIDQSKGRIRNTFRVVPDVPVEKFRMNLKGGNGGLLVNSKDICKGKKALRRANVAMAAHNGAKLKNKQSVVKCGGKKRR